MKRMKIKGFLLLLLLATPGFTDPVRFGHNRLEEWPGDCGGPFGACVTGLSITFVIEGE